MFVDDINLDTFDMEEAMVQKRLVAAFRDAQRFVREDLDCEFAPAKGAVLATSMKLARSISRALKGDAGEAAKSAPNLGIDYACGRSRRVAFAKSKRGKRFHKSTKLRKKKIAIIRKQVGHRTQKIFTAGQRPSIAYGSAVNGISPVELLAFQRAAGRTSVHLALAVRFR